MRSFSAVVLVLGCVAALAACGASPQSLGLTGAPQMAPPVSPSDADIGRPGLSQGTLEYAPSLVPSTGGGRYYGTE